MEGDTKKFMDALVQETVDIAKKEVQGYFWNYARPMIGTSRKRISGRVE